MHTLWFAGLLLSLAVGFVLAALFFAHAWLWRRREVESLLLGVGTLAVGIYSFAVGMFYLDVDLPTAAGARAWADIAIGAGIVALALTLQFGLRFTAARHERAIMTVAYALVAAFMALLLSGNWWAHEPEAHEHFAVWGVPLALVRLQVRWPAMLYYALIPIVIGAVALRIGRRWRNGHAELRPAWFGALLLGAGAVNDALALGAGWYRSVSLMPLGYAAFIHGVSMTLLARYGLLSNALRARTAQVARRSDELETAVRKLEDAQQRLVEREQLAVLGQLAGVVAREVREPIGRVLRTARAFDAGRPAGPEALARLDEIDQQIARLDRLVGELLDFARPLSPQRAAADLRQLLTAVLQRTDGQVRTSLSLSPELEDLELLADAHLLRRAFDNLVDNAIDAMHGAGELHIEASRRQVDGVDCALVDLCDTGEGMTARHSEQAMSPLFTTRVDGAGLGLPIAARVVEAHGGAIEVRSERGKGTTVRVLLPLDAERELPHVGRRRISSRPPA